MSNICDTTTYIYAIAGGKGEAQLRKLHKTLQDIPREGPSIALGSVLSAHGLPVRGCQGSILELDGIERRNNLVAFRIEEKSAWRPCYVWNRVLCLEQYSELSEVYKSEEPGCGLYINNDSSGIFFLERYIVDSLDLTGDFPDDTYFFSTDDELMEFLADTFDIHAETLEEAQAAASRFAKEHGDGLLKITEYRYS